MINIIDKALKKLFPAGLAWKQLAFFIQALRSGSSIQINESRIFLKDLQREFLPITADDTIQEWFELLGLTYDGTKTLEDLQIEATSRYIQIGGQWEEYIEGIIHDAGFTGIDIIGQGIMIPEIQSSVCGVALCGDAVCQNFENGGHDSTWWAYFIVSGLISGDQSSFILDNLVNFLRPGHLQPVNEYSYIGGAGFSEDGTTEINAEFSEDGASAINKEFGV